MDPEDIDGVRMTWNVWPQTKVEASKCVVPLAACVLPLRPHPDVLTMPYPPLRCKTCTSILNPFCRIDFAARIWICPFCFQRNHFPPHYSEMSDTNLPAELYPNYTTMQYAIPSPSHHQPQFGHAAAAGSVTTPSVFLFVLDTCMIEEELIFAKSALKQAIGLVPDNALVGFISYGTQVQVHELGFSELSKVYVFRGSKEIGKDQVLEQLGLGASGGRRAGAGGGGFQKGMIGQNGFAGAGTAGTGAAGVSRFLLPASECEYAIDAVRMDGGSVQDKILDTTAV